MLKMMLFLLGLLFLLASLSAVIASPLLLERTAPMIEGYQSRHTKSVDIESVPYLTNVLLYSCIVAAGGMGLYFLACLNDRFRKATVRALPLLCLGLFLTTLALIYTYSPTALAVFPFLYREDGLLETLTAVGFLVSAFFFGKAAWSAKRMGDKHRAQGYSLIFGVCISFTIVSFVVAMEEISWGQRIFGWETPGFMVAANVQKESNLHNIANRYFDVMYRFLIILPLAGLVNVCLSAFKRNSNSIRHMLPQIHLLGLSILIGVLAAAMPYPPTELLEELVALFTVSYSIQLARTFRAPDLRPRPADFAIPGKGEG